MLSEHIKNVSECNLESSGGGHYDGTFSNLFEGLKRWNSENLIPTRVTVVF